MATIRQIARACQVSPMAVSFVLNNKPGEVSEETRERVLRAVREMGYRPRARPRQRDAGIHTIGISAGVPNASFVNDGYFRAVLQGLMTAAEERRLNTLVFHREVFYLDSRDAIRVYLDGHCEGLLLLAPGEKMPLVGALVERGIPFVSIGRPFTREDVAFVDVDNRAVGRRAAEHLLDLGHRRIAFFGDDAESESVSARRAGYREALGGAGLTVDPEWEYIPAERAVGRQVWLDGLMALPSTDRPTAFFAWNDTAAQWLVCHLKRHGHSVPEQVSVVGVDDDPSSATSDPALTTLRQPYRELAEAAVDALQARIRDAQSPPVRRLFDSDLIVRGSTAGPPDRNP